MKSFSWGEWNAASGTVEMQPFAFTMPVGVASPELFLACAAGNKCPNATLTVRDAAGRDYLIVEFTNVLVTSYKTSADTSQDDQPLDEIALRFEEIVMIYVPYDTNGAAGTPIKRKWDFVKKALYQ